MTGRDLREVVFAAWVGTKGEALRRDEVRAIARRRVGSRWDVYQEGHLPLVPRRGGSELITEHVEDGDTTPAQQVWVSYPEASLFLSPSLSLSLFRSRRGIWNGGRFALNNYGSNGVKGRFRFARAAAERLPAYDGLDGPLIRRIRDDEELNGTSLHDDSTVASTVRSETGTGE